MATLSLAPCLDVELVGLQPERVADADVLGDLELEGNQPVRRLFVLLVDHLPDVAAAVLETECLAGGLEPEVDPASDQDLASGAADRAGERGPTAEVPRARRAGRQSQCASGIGREVDLRVPDAPLR